jgi:serine/threonine protein kinase
VYHAIGSYLFAQPQYRTGRTLGSGTYAIVKEAIHVTTGKYYACKVINKKLMEGREYMVSVSAKNL